MEITPEQRQAMLEKILGKMEQPKVLPQVVYQVLETTNNDNGSVTSLERQISVDPGFTARLLAMSNSAYFALPKRVTSVKDAVMMLGMGQIREVAMNASVFDFFVGKTDKESVRRRDWWRISLETAAVARWLADGVADASPNEAYTAGLLHYLGKTAIDNFDPTGYDKIDQVVAQGGSERVAERVLFKADHIDLACELAARWKFPPTLVNAMNYEDEPPTDCPGKSLKGIVSIAHHVALYHFYNDAKYVEQSKQLEWVWPALGFALSDADNVISAGLAQLTSRPIAA